MLFLNINDIRTFMFSVFITESENDFAGVLDEIEKNNIALIKSKIGLRYNTDLIFSQTGETRDRNIIKVLSLLCIYDLVRRNSARKIPDDFRLDWDWAMRWLNDVRDGKEAPPNLPLIDQNTNNGLSKVYYGNTKNEDFYL